MAENIERKQQMESLHAKGLTYAEIAEVFGISRQRVCQLIGKGNKCFFHTVTKKKCRYGGIREWMNDNMVSVTELTRRVYGHVSPNNYQRMRCLLMGTNEPKKTYIDKILSITGLVYEEAFKEG